MKRRILLLLTATTAMIALMSFPVIYFVAQLVARPLNELSLEAKKLKNFNLDEPLETRSRIREVQRLAVSVDQGGGK